LLTKLKINKKFDKLWSDDYSTKTEYLRTLQKLVQDAKEQRKSRFDFSIQSSLDQNEEIILEITKENLKMRDYLQYKEILKLIEFRMEQTYYDFPKEYIQDDIWRKFSKYVRPVLPRIVKVEKTCTCLPVSSKF
jgi:hypothetical protein